MGLTDPLFALADSRAERAVLRIGGTVVSPGEFIVQALAHVALGTRTAVCSLGQEDLLLIFAWAIAGVSRCLPSPVDRVWGMAQSVLRWPTAEAPFLLLLLILHLSAGSS